MLYKGRVRFEGTPDELRRVDDPVVRGTFAVLINRTAGMTSSGTYGSCEEALESFARKAPHVVLMDIGLPGISGIEGARIIRERFSFVDILMLTVYDDDEKIFRSICAGASGYVLKNSEPSEIVHAISEIQTKNCACDPAGLWWRAEKFGKGWLNSLLTIA